MSIQISYAFQCMIMKYVHKVSQWHVCYNLVTQNIEFVSLRSVLRPFVVTRNVEFVISLVAIILCPCVTETT